MPVLPWVRPRENRERAALASSSRERCSPVGLIKPPRSPRELRRGI
ncbi:hypothetical protein ACFPRL_21510 [Pseudoclavibacter helvolus]